MRTPGMTVKLLKKTRKVLARWESFFWLNMDYKGRWYRVYRGLAWIYRLPPDKRFEPVYPTVKMESCSPFNKCCYQPILIVIAIILLWVRRTVVLGLWSCFFWMHFSSPPYLTVSCHMQVLYSTRLYYLGPYNKSPISHSTPRRYMPQCALPIQLVAGTTVNIHTTYCISIHKI